MENRVVDALLSQARQLHPQDIDLSLDRLARLLDRLGNPQDRLPPVFHVAGTNGKGSTVAFLRACLEAAGNRVHVYTSPHLVRVNERIRLAGKLIDDDALVATLRDVLQVNAGAPITVFEIITAAAFLAFSRVPADACVLEVGMGGRLDATNVVKQPAACGIAQLGLDHTQFLGSTILDIAGEKAGIAKAGVPLVLSRYPRTVTARIGEVAGVVGARLLLRGQDWDATLYNNALHYKDDAGKLELPAPRLIGAHQIDNAGLAIAMLRHQGAVPVPDAAFRAGMGWAEWPARLQRLSSGALHELLPAGAELWLDGGHNPLAGRVLADRFRAHNLAERPFYLVLGLLTTKDAAGFLRPFAGRATALYAVPIPGHDSHSPTTLAGLAEAIAVPGRTADSVAAALKAIARGADRQRPPVVLVCGSLYLAGTVLEESGLLPS
ncbi:bifunctional folylpolyglutamate synthase/dihydrofolate synthase [Parapedomonas caeni]|jgi:dihydrofolate synthase/folylpolyglutamate synthase